MDLIDFARLHGLIVDQLPRIGESARYRTVDKPAKRNGWIKNNGTYGFVRNHATMSEPDRWKPDAQVAPPTPKEEAEIRARRERDAAYRAQAIKSARAFWAESSPLSRIHPYIDKKGLTPQGCAGLRQNDGLLVIPVMWGDRLTSIQTIALDGAKRFWPGAPVKGGAYVIQRPQAAVTVLCEGLATGLAIFQSVRQARVIVCFNSGNLLPVVERLRPHGSVCIFADNDHATQIKTGINPGIKAAENAAALIDCGVAYPTGISGTDAADMVAEIGEGAAKKIERLVLAHARLVMT